MKKNIFEKLGLVERQEADLPNYPEYEQEDTTEYYDNVPAGDASATNFVSDIYDANGLADKSRSIFKVEEICKTLPDMTDATKHATVCGILSSFNLSPEEVSLDAEQRINFVNGALQSYSDNTDESIAAKESEIAKAKAIIEENEKAIAMLEEDKKSVTNQVTMETERITKLVNFISQTKGGNEK